MTNPHIMMSHSSRDYHYVVILHLNRYKSFVDHGTLAVIQNLVLH